MSTVYTGVPTLTSSITIPADGDLANAASVNVSAKALLDMQTFLFQTFGQDMQSTSPIRCYSVPGSTKNITIDPMPLILVNELGTWKTIALLNSTTVGVAQIEGAPGDYSVDTWYYVYIYSVAGLAQVLLSTTPPDIYNLYRTGGQSHKYIASFKTNGTNVTPFSRYGNSTQYLSNLNVGGSPSLTRVPLLTSSFIPPIPASSMGRFCKLLIKPTNVGAASSLTLFCNSTIPVGYEIFVPQNTTTSLCIEMPTDAANNLYYISASSSLTFQAFIVGYTE